MLLYHYPPTSAAGTFRGYRFAKFLKQLGWDPIVVTTDNESAGYPRDDSLLQWTDTDVPTEEAWIWRPLLKWRQERARRKIAGRHNRVNANTASVDQGASSKTTSTPSSAAQPKQARATGFLLLAMRRVFESILYFECFFPDRNGAWFITCWYRALKTLKQHPCEIIFATSPPMSTHMAATIVGWLRGIPVVLDYRDPWHCGDHPSWLRKRVQAVISKFCFRRAAGFVFNTEAAQEQFRSQYPENNHKRMQVITNGIDPDVIADIAQQEKPTDDAKVRICHPGVLWGTRNMSGAVRGVAELVQRGLDIEFDQVGRIADQETIKLIAECGLTDRVVTVEQRIPYQAVLDKLSRSDIFLLLGNNNHQQIPSKIYDMLMFDTPILVVEADGSSRRFVETFDLGLAVDGNDPTEFADAVAELLSRPKHASESRKEARQRYDYLHLTESLSDLLKSTVSDSDRPSTNSTTPSRKVAKNTSV